MDLSRLDGLRGCGGAGFPAAFKWNAVRDEPLVGTPETGGGKVIVCNADEGEPGTFKDGWLFREQPEVVLRGMQRAAEFAGAARGYVYLRPEYVDQLETLKTAIASLVTSGVLSEGSGALWAGAGFAGRPAQSHNTGLDDVALSALDWFVEHGAEGLQGSETEHGGLATGHAFGEGLAFPLTPRCSDPVRPAPETGFAFRIDICIGGGAYICGEETALLESMEGRRPQPRHKPPFPTQSGLWGLPTLMNNVETFWWAERLLSGDFQGEGGTHRLYSLSGDVHQPGVYEAPVGITAQELVDQFGGGVKGGGEVSCWIPGGAATGVLPGHLLSTALSSEGLKEVGTAPGTAAVVIFAKRDPREVAANIMQFFAQESCSQCTPCRLGCRAVASWLSGSTAFPDADTEERWLESMELGSICGLGFTAPLVLRLWRRWFSESGVVVV